MVITQPPSLHLESNKNYEERFQGTIPNPESIHEHIKKDLMGEKK